MDKVVDFTHLYRSKLRAKGPLNFVITKIHCNRTKWAAFMNKTNVKLELGIA